ncbi:MAG: glycosyl transferase family 1, partial [Bacteroidales bacterium]|nr:glycosyl transferase family 1 [Bacteroidales bacterium]
MKKVLIITYYWPPSGGSGVQRWLKFAKYLPQYGWEPVVYTPENPEANSIDEALLKDVGPQTTVIKRKIVEPYGFYKALSGKKGSQIKANLVSSSNNKKSFVQRLSLFIRGNLFIPDPRILWVAPSVRFLKKYLKENPVDAIVSTGPPHSMHLIAKKLSKSTDIPWLADFRDPWTGIFYFKHLGLSKFAYRRHRKLEQSVLNNA